MSQGTPERITPRSSRVATPGSRRRSKTPVRTPRRRRATIVSANLLTPRRQKRTSTTPQRTLRLLSKALAKESQSTSSRPIHRDREEQISDHETERGRINDKSITSPSILSSPHIPQSPEQIDFDLHDDKGLEEDVHQPVSIDEVEFKRRLSFRSSGQHAPQGLSDIALPVGLMPDDVLDSGPFSDPFAPLSEDDEQLPSSVNAANRARQSDSQYQNDLDESVVIKKQKLQKSINQKHFPGQTTEFSASSNIKLQKFTQSFSKRKLGKSAMTTLKQTSDHFFSQISSDIAAYTKHSKSKETFNINAVYLLLKRQRQISSAQSLLDLADQYLPLEHVIEIQRNLHKLQK